MEILRGAVILGLGTRLVALQCRASPQATHLSLSIFSGWLTANQMKSRRVVEQWKTNL